MALPRRPFVAVPTSGAWHWLFLLAGLLVGHLGGVAGFNVDVDRAVTYSAGQERGQGRPESRSRFGFAITQHVSTDGEARILVGAPRANTTQPGITEGGAVYDCGLSANPTSTISCNVMEFDTGGNGEDEEKSGQGFGSTVVSDKSSGTAMGCAPRYRYFTENVSLPIGICYYYNGLTRKSTILNPIQERARDYTKKKMTEWLYVQEGAAQYGFSAALSGAGAYMVVGSPGSFTWSGRFWFHTSKDPIGRKKSKQARYGHNRRSTGPPEYFGREHYFGYSVAFGNFTSSKDLDFIIAAPRGGSQETDGPGTLSGNLRVFNSRLIMHEDSFVGEQMGQYLGYTLAVGDFNGDGLDDIAAGAPFYSVKDSYNTGQVLILNQPKLGIIYRGERLYLEGHRRAGEMFGISLAVIGDINQDGFTDLAVGAPNGGREGQGAVYIFHGSAHGLKRDISQMIDAASIKSSSRLKTFGFSLSGGLDMDNNGYPDITVGGYESEHVVQLWSRPVIRLYLNVTMPAVVYLEQQDIVRDGANYAGFIVKINHRYHGNEPNSTTKLNITVRLDADQKNSPRAYFLVGIRRTTMLKTQIVINNAQGEGLVLQQQTYMKHAVRDKLSPIIVEVKYNVTSEYTNGLAPVFDVDIPTTLRPEVTIGKHCGPDRTCIADLKLTAEAITRKFVLGNSAIDIKVTVENLEPEGAFEAVVIVHLPPGTLYAKVYDKSPMTMRCSPVNTYVDNVTESNAATMQNSTRAVQCEIGNPLLGHRKVEFTLQFDANNFDGSFDHLTFSFNANSSNPENATTLDNNQAEVRVQVYAETPLRISGKSEPEQAILVTNSEMDNPPKGGPTSDKVIIHLYEVRNQGPSTVKTASVMVYWPSRFPDDDDNLGDLLILTDVKVEYNGNIDNCSILYEPAPAQNSTEAPTAHVARNKRNVQTYTEKLLNARKHNKKVVCMPGGNESWCAIIKCDVGQLSPDERALVTIKARLSVTSLSQLQHMTILVTSEGQAQVESLPYHGISQPNWKTDPVAVDTILATKGPAQAGIQWWIIAAAVVSGIICLSIVIGVLYKCGFFKRSQYGDDEVGLNSATEGYEGDNEDEEHEDDDVDARKDEDKMLAQFAQGEAGNRSSCIDTVNRKLILKNGVSISIEEKR